MKVYVVRHGESEGNVRRTFQTSTELLTKSGERQASIVAKRFSHINISRIIASTMTRAQQTANEISKTTKKKVISDALLSEKRQPSEMVGKSHIDPQCQSIAKKINTNIDDPDYHFSDEENHWDFIKRIQLAMQGLEKYENDDAIAVVTHGHALRCMLGIVLLESDFSPHDFDTFAKGRVLVNNTGITVFQYSLESGWQLITFNDHAHLLD